MSSDVANRAKVAVDVEAADTTAPLTPTRRAVQCATSLGVGGELPAATAEAASKAVAAATVSCVMYVGCSTIMVLTNKWLASTLGVRAHVSLLLMQNAVATLAVSLCKATGIVSYADFDARIALQWLPVNLCFVVMLLTSFVAMRYLSVPMITIFKQLANLVTVSGEFYLFGKPVSRMVILSFATMIFGAILAAANDLAFSAVGYSWQAANCFSTSSYVLYLKHATRSVQLSKFGMVFYNNLLSLPMLALVAVSNGEPSALLDAHSRGLLDLSFFALNALAGCIGFLLNLASVWCVSATSATTYAVVGALNKIPVTILGFLIFRLPISKEMAIYVSLSLVGGFLYSYDKVVQTTRAK
ncbi:hypothetical protein CTAYLR_003433 [Chrysophaeum taylorii]|uniref:Sugar phosphate transporter domain-containing protein n=1 Tax=Chrysophaeum taylorii TaxID=2483200 RepID=A0AAD7U9Q8_9STRA|nr:hypothetical protein CTAYLR_003433 [Chrysophaeum taylorii]